MAYLIGLLLGVLLGVSGTGGSLFAVPVLVVLLNIPVHEAMGLALGAVTLSAIAGALRRRRDILLRPGLLMALAGALSAPLGRALAAHLDGFWLMIGFTLLAAAGAASLWSKPNHTTPSAGGGAGDGDNAILLSAGLAIGFLSGMFGVGGGMLIVPFLQRVADRGMQATLVTSLLIISIVSGAGFLAGLRTYPPVDPSMLWQLSSAGILGTLLGQRLSLLLPQHYLSKLIALLLMAVSLFSLSARAAD